MSRRRLILKSVLKREKRYSTVLWMKYAARQGIQQVDVARQSIHFAYPGKTQKNAAQSDTQRYVAKVVARKRPFAVMG